MRLNACQKCEGHRLVTWVKRAPHESCGQAMQGCQHSGYPEYHSGREPTGSMSEFIDECHSFQILANKSSVGTRGFMDFREASAVFESVKVMRLLILRIEAMQSSGKKMA